MIKYSLQELLNCGDTMTLDANKIVCWVDLPIINNEHQRIVKSNSPEWGSDNSQYRVCKSIQKNRTTYSIRKVSFNSKGNPKKISRGCTKFETHDCSDERCLMEFERKIRDISKALKAPVLNLNELKNSIGHS